MALLATHQQENTNAWFLAQLVENSLQFTGVICWGRDIPSEKKLPHDQPHMPNQLQPLINGDAIESMVHKYTIKTTKYSGTLQPIAGNNHHEQVQQTINLHH